MARAVGTAPFTRFARRIARRDALVFDADEAGAARRKASLCLVRLIVRSRRLDIRRFPHPFIEVGRADGERIPVDERRHAHCRLASVGKSIEADAPRVDERLSGQPFDNALMLSDDEREQRQLERMPFSLDDSKAVMADVRILWRKSDEALLGKARALARLGI
jgi:hypothetical protein